MSTKSRSKSTLKKKSLPRNLIRAQLAGEMAATFGADEQSIRTTQEGFASGAFRSLDIFLVDKDGRAHDVVRFNVDRHDNGNDHISIDGDDSRSMIECFDGGYAKAVAHAKARADRKNLRAEARFRFTDEIERDPDRKRAEQERLGTYTCDPPPTADGYTIKRVAKYTPGKDRDQSMEFFWGKKSRS